MDAAKKQDLFIFLFLAALAAMPVIAVAVPRFVGVGPGLIGVAGFAVWPFVFGGRPPLSRSVAYWTGGILLLAAASCLWAVFPHTALLRTLKTAGVLVPGLLLVSLAAALPPGRLRPHLWILPAAVAAAAALIVLEIALDFPIYRLTHHIASGHKVNGAKLNRSAVTALACGVPVMAALHLNGKTRAGILALFGVMAMLTSSQSFQLGFALAVLLYAVFPYRRRGGWTALAAVLVAGIAGAPFIAVWMFDHLAGTVNTLPFFGKGGGFGGERLEIWDFVSRYALGRPFYGYGIDATRHITDFDIKHLFWDAGTVLHPHNIVLQFWIEFGVLGALFLCGFFVWLLRVCREAGSRVVLPSFAALMTVGAFGYGMWQAWWLGVVFLGAAYTTIAARAGEETQAPV